MANILEPIKKVLKIKKVCLRTYYIVGHLKRPRGPHAARAGADLARKFRRGDFSNIWQSSLSWQSSVFPYCTKSW